MHYPGATVSNIWLVIIMPGLTLAAQNGSLLVPQTDYGLYATTYQRQYNHSEGTIYPMELGPYNLSKYEYNDVPPDYEYASLAWIHGPAEHADIMDLIHLLNTLYFFFDADATVATLATSLFYEEASDCAQHPCLQTCNERFYCLMMALLLGSRRSHPDTEEVYIKCLAEKFDISRNEEDASTWKCHIFLTQSEWDTTDDGDVPNQHTNCEDNFFDLTHANWANSDVDENLQIALRGGVDTRGVFWEGQRAGEPMAEAIGRQFWDTRGVKCTIDTPCQPVLDCERIGSYTAIKLGKLHSPMKLPWVLFASSAFKNVNQQLVNQYNELKDAIESLALDTFSMDEFYKTERQDFSVQNSLTGLGGLFAIFGGFVPVVGPAIETAGTITSGVASYLANAAASNDPSEVQGAFSEKVLSYYRGLLSGMEDIVAKLFIGDRIGDFNLTDMIRNGSWVNPDSLTRVSDLNRKIRTEILARSIDSLWKTPPSNKVWVLFTHLQDDANKTKCRDGTLSQRENIFLYIYPQESWKL